MKGTKLLLAFWLSTAAFCLLQVLLGPGGVTETARLRHQQSLLEVRLEALKAENQSLTARYEALRTSAETIRLEARALGWFPLGEVPIRTIAGSEFRLPADGADLSTVPRLPESSNDLAWFFRFAWVVLLAIFWTILYLVERLWPAMGRWERFWPAPKGNLPMVLQTGLDFFRK